MAPDQINRIAAVLARGPEAARVAAALLLRASRPAEQVGAILAGLNASAPTDALALIAPETRTIH
jgi:hypothetical protein